MISIAIRNKARLVAIALSGAVVAVSAQSPTVWLDAGVERELGASAEYQNFYGTGGVWYSGHATNTAQHPFFAPLGGNGRACVSCHQPAYAMSISAAGANDRWHATAGKDPLFAAVDGANCPHLPPDQMSHSLLLERGLFRVALPWPPRDREGREIEPEFELEVVRDPTNCNLHPDWGLRSKHRAVSVYRRPRPVANLKYVIDARAARMLLQKSGAAAAIDAATGRPQSMNLLADARWPTLALQIQDAARVHLQRDMPLANEQMATLHGFVLQVFAAQVASREGGVLEDADAPSAIGPRQLARQEPGGVGENLAHPVFGSFAQWKQSGLDAAQREFRASVARGNEIFHDRKFWIRDAMHVNALRGNPLKHSCAGCHSARTIGMEPQAGWIDIGTNNLPWARESPELPLFKITCDRRFPPHPFLGRVLYTHDPGRALISGKCEDVGAIVMQQLRGLAARPPYFAGGGARTLREVIDFYDRRFNIGFAEREKQDLVNFLSAL